MITPTVSGNFPSAPARLDPKELNSNPTFGSGCGTAYLANNFPHGISKASGDGLPIPLKALIIAISAIAGAVIGFLAANLAGLAIGAAIGIGIGFAAVRLISGPTPPGTLGQDIKIPDIGENSFATMGHSFLGTLWMYGTQSLMLSYILAAYRQTDLSLMEGPALMPGNEFIKRGLKPLKSSHYCHQDVLVGTRNLPHAKNQTCCSSIKDCFVIDALDNIRFNPAETDLLTDPFPLIFAAEAKNLNAIKRIVPDIGCLGHFVESEILDIDHPLFLGKDITHILTAEKNIPRIKAALGALNAQVKVIATA